MKEYAFGIDLGGTTAKIGLFTTTGDLLEKWEVPTDTSDQGARILPNLAAAVQDKMAQRSLRPDQIEGVGLGVPGPVQDSSVVAIVCANLGGWGDCDAGAQLSQLLGGLRVQVGNDANVAALGEIWMGAAKGCRSAVMVTLGTGVGGGVVINGHVIAGVHGLGGELGHIHVRDEEKEFCNCGGRGCLEQVASATGIAREARRNMAASTQPSALRKFGDKVTAKNVCDCANDGDSMAMETLDTACRWLWPMLLIL